MQGWPPDRAQLPQFLRNQVPDPVAEKNVVVLPAFGQLVEIAGVGDPSQRQAGATVPEQGGELLQNEAAVPVLVFVLEHKEDAQRRLKSLELLEHPPVPVKLQANNLNSGG